MTEKLIPKAISSAEWEREKPILPKCSYPHPPYHFRGQGIALIYEIPYERVRGVIPNIFGPAPGKGKIWFMVNFYNWGEFYPHADPSNKYQFLEAYYKFSVDYSGKLGDYPIKLYLNSDMGIASGIELYGYPKYKAEMSYNLDDDGTNVSSGSFLIKRDDKIELEIVLKRATGPIAKIMTMFANITAKSYLKQYVGNYLSPSVEDCKEFTFGQTRITKIRYDLAEVSRIYLREPVEWNILTEDEAAKPKYAFILTDTEADLDPPEVVKL